MAFALEPLAAGEPGPRSDLDTSVHPPRVRRVQYVLDAPTTEDLIESFPVFLVSEALAASLTAAGLIGFALTDAEVIPSVEYRAAWGDTSPKRYRWLRIEPAADADCWIDSEYRLCVSDEMYGVLARHEIGRCEVTRLG